MANEQNLKPWKPGQSGNPKGRPRKIPELETLIDEVLGEEKDGTKAIIAIVRNLRRIATGNHGAQSVRAAEILLDRTYGKPKQPIEASGELGLKGSVMIGLPPVKGENGKTNQSTDTGSAEGKDEDQPAGSDADDPRPNGDSP